MPKLQNNMIYEHRCSTRHASMQYGFRCVHKVQADWEIVSGTKMIIKKYIFNVVVLVKNHVEMCTFLHALLLNQPRFWIEEALKLIWISQSLSLSLFLSEFDSSKTLFMQQLSLAVMVAYQNCPNDYYNDVELNHETLHESFFQCHIC